MKIRASRTLVFTREEGQVVAYNYLARSVFCCEPDLFQFLAMVENWTGLDEMERLLPLTPKDEVEATVRSLIEVGALVEKDLPSLDAESAFLADWRWGVPTALFHLSVQDREYMTLEQSEALQRAHLTEAAPPPLYQTNGWANGSAIRLPDALAGSDLLQLMARRRTVRAAAKTSPSLSQISECLFAGLGITGETENAVGKLPLSMTPSGGARNPYEAYIYARRVDGLDPGFYHYSAKDHTLAQLETEARPMPSELLGGQDWTDDMPCVVFLCALLERTMWKYEDANAYRVVLIEAGHIGQNLMLAATRHGLTACPTAALNHSAINRCVAAKDSFTHTPVYALTLAYPGDLH